MKYYLTANKTKMVKLLQSKGYKPTVKKSKFEKAFRMRSFWLSWLEGSGLHRALLMSAGGRPYLRVTNNEEEKMFPLCFEELNKYNMTEVIE